MTRLAVSVASGMAACESCTEAEYYCWEFVTLMRARPGHFEPPNVNELTMKGEESRVEEPSMAHHPREASRLAETIRRRIDVGEWIAGKDVLQYLKQIPVDAPD